MIFYLLNKKQRVIKAISSKKIIEAHFVEGINQANQLVLSLPLKERLNPNIFYALFEKPDSTEYLMFKLINEDVQNDRVTYNGVDSAYDELKGYGYVKDIRPVKRTAKEILQRVLQDTRWKVGYIDSTNPVDTNFYYQTYLDCIQQIVKLFNLEVTFTYGFDTRHQQITSRKVNLYLQQGRRTGKRFEYGSNLLEVTREEDSQNIVTALVGRGKGEEKYDDSTGEPTDGYGRRIGFSDVVWSKANGDPVDKPLGQEYVEDPEATKIFGYDDGKPRTGVIVFDDIDDPVELLKATWASLKSSDRPKVSFKAQVTDVGNLQLGDTIAIIRHEIGIEYFTRVFKVDHDLLNKNNSTIEMGDDMSDRSLYSYISNVDTTAKQAVQSANQAAVAAGFKSKNYYSTTKPAIADEGDNLWLNLGNGEFEHWVWHNHQWQFINSTQDLHNVEQSVKDQQAELEKVKHSANDANSKVDDLNQNTTANIATIKADLKSAQDDVASAKQEIQANGGKILSVDKRVDGLSVAVGNNTNSISKVDQKADAIKQTVANNTKDISTVTQTANSVSSIVNDESTGLSAILQKVDSVSSVVNDKEHGLSAVNQKADSLTTQIVGKADTSQLIQLSDQIKTKVDSKDFTSQIDQLNNNINLKVSKGDVLGQINIEAGSTLIQNKKLYLDADSVVFSGKAFIPDAAITNISADKINAGTLDAGKINVINLNADNIVAGTLSGKNVNMNLTSGDIRFSGGRFHNANDTFDINIDEHYFYSEDKNNLAGKTSLLIKDGELTLGKGSIFTSNDDYFKVARTESITWGGLNGSAVGTATVLAGTQQIALVQARDLSDLEVPFFDQTDSNNNQVQAYRNKNFVGVGVSQPYSSNYLLEKNPYTIYISSGDNGSALIQGKRIEIDTYVNSNTDSYVPTVEIGTNFKDLGLTHDPGYDTFLQAQTFYINFDHNKNTIGMSPNLALDITGRLVQTTSASRFKTNIQRLTSDDYGEKLLNVLPAIWNDKSELKQYKAFGLKPRKSYGMIAEDVADAGLELLVSRDKNGEITGIQYDRIGVALIPVVKKLKQKVERLEEQINEQSKSN